MKKRAGLLCPVFSVPGNQGIGDFGQKTIRMIDAIADAGYSIWQILPLHMMGYTHSPYQSLSSFAGDPIYINLDRLSEMGLLTQSSIVNCNKFKDFVDYDAVRAFKEPYLQRAFKAFKKNFSQYADEFSNFKKEAFWLDDWVKYALFKKLYDQRAWTEWEEEYRDWPLNREEAEIDLKDYLDEMFYQQFLQFIFYKQFDAITEYARSRGLQIMQDLPFYADYDSCDVWSRRQDFMVEKDGKLIAVKAREPKNPGEMPVMSDIPAYNFDQLRAEDYQFWLDRVKWMERNADIIRLNHFGNFEKYYTASPATGKGEWLPGPREELLYKILQENEQIQLAADDGMQVSSELAQIENKFGIAGIDVLESRMDAKQLKKTIRPDSILYTGTHDFPTLEEDYMAYDNNKRISLRRFFKKRGSSHRSFHDMVCSYALGSDAETVILPIQDVLGLKGKARMNVPGSDSEKNWTWKLKDFKIFPRELLKTKEWIEASGRC